MGTVVLYMHNKRIVHRDLKVCPVIHHFLLFQPSPDTIDIQPENLLLTTTADNAELKLADFGMAEPIPMGQELLPSAMAGGTPGYLSPEILLGQVDPHLAPCTLIPLVTTLVGFPLFFYF